MKRSALFSYLQLIRLPNLFTASADIVTGYLLVGAWTKEWANLSLLIFSSCCLYAGGVALNDYMDIEEDSRYRPQRPIPSGQVSGPSALALAVILLILGVAAAATVSVQSAMISVLIVILIVLYDAMAKSFRLLGPLTMGLCRYFNLTLGMSVIVFPTSYLLIPLVSLVYVFGITYLSKSETEDITRARYMPTIAALCITFLLFFILNIKGILPNSTALTLVFLFLIGLGAALRMGIRGNIPHTIPRMVGMMVGGIIILDACIVVGMRDIGPALLVASLLVPMILLNRVMYVT